MNNTGLLIATQSGTVNLNVDQKTLDMCVKGTSGWAGVTYQNICNGQSYFVANGAFDYILVFILIALGISFVLMLLKIVFDFGY